MRRPASPRRPASGQALVSWTAPGANGSPITSYTVTPFIGATAQTPVQVNNGSATSTTVTGLTNGTAYTFKVTATNAIGTSAASAPSAAITPDDTIFDFATPARVDSGDTTSGKPWRQVHGRHQRPDPGHPLLQGRREHRHPHRQSVDARAASCSRRRRSRTRPPRAGRPSCSRSPVSITAGTTYVASYFDPNGHYSLHRVAVRVASRQRAAARRWQRHQPERRLQHQLGQRLPDKQLQRKQLLGRRRSSSRPRPGR